ncbi:MAG: hypothetical protein WCP21_17975, partial [Armatimonadota bacterium]
MSFLAVHDMPHTGEKIVLALANVGADAITQVQLIDAAGRIVDAKTVGQMITCAAWTTSDQEPLMVTASNNHRIAGVSVTGDGRTTPLKLVLRWQHRIALSGDVGNNQTALHPNHIVKGIVADRRVAVAWFEHPAADANSLVCVSVPDGRTQWSLIWPGRGSVCDLMVAGN